MSLQNWDKSQCRSVMAFSSETDNIQRLNRIYQRTSRFLKRASSTVSLVSSNANLNEGSYTLKEKYGEVKMANREINTRIKFDENVQNVQLIQLLEHKVAILFKNENDEKRLLKSNKVLLELDWYNEGKIYFEYDVKGVSQAIKNMKEKCKK